jgi:hypothetical protein
LARQRFNEARLDHQSLAFVEQRHDEVSAAADTLAKFDSLDFAPFFSREMNGKPCAGEVMDLFSRSIPIVFWSHIFHGFLPAWGSAQPGPAISRAHTSVFETSASH